MARTRRGRARALAAAAALLGAIASWSGNGQAQAPAGGQRVGFVDLQRVIARCQIGGAAREQLERERVGLQKQLDGPRNDVAKLKDELDKKGSLMTPEARREKQDALERRVRDGRRLVDDLQKDMQKREQDVMLKVFNDVAGVVQQYGKDKGYHLIVERRGGAVMWGTPETDITEEITRACDDAAKKGKK